MYGGETGVYCCDDEGAVVLDSDADADDSEVHYCDWPDAPVEEDAEEVAHGPGVVGGAC